ncbi:hypothetical protein Ait01nite_070570 [Actinoplanes italicus]|uniref:hypothetical protein n=1 Tax=Actinoplanes italicus TaxID=113567 RepID=UPI0011B1F01A|nr:hypothetical protein [Actinoplanes italicus]GIE34012.1 hypothetical protein Ait01nite_070570 [Actinoplanes italicus]
MLIVQHRNVAVSGCEPQLRPVHRADADFVTGDYPQSRDDATVRLLGCVDHQRGRFQEAVGRAGPVTCSTGKGRVVARAAGHPRRPQEGDTGLIDPVTGTTTDPTTPRGRVRRNFEKAVTGAVVETRRQWQDFTRSLRREYGPRRAATMTCALTHDHPVRECDGSGRTSVVRGLSGVGIVLVLVAVAVWLYRRGAGPRVRRTDRRGFRRVWRR